VTELAGIFLSAGERAEPFFDFDCAGGVYLPLLEATSVVSGPAGTSWATVRNQFNNIGFEARRSLGQAATKARSAVSLEETGRATVRGSSNFNLSELRIGCSSH
jgi:hypothetical protein